MLQPKVKPFDYSVNTRVFSSRQLHHDNWLNFPLHPTDSHFNGAWTTIHRQKRFMNTLYLIAFDLQSMQMWVSWLSTSLENLLWIQFGHDFYEDVMNEWYAHFMCIFFNWNEWCGCSSDKISAILSHLQSGRVFIVSVVYGWLHSAANLEWKKKQIM